MPVSRTAISSNRSTPSASSWRIETTTSPFSVNLIAFPTRFTNDLTEPVNIGNEPRRERPARCHMRVRFPYCLLAMPAD